jgi:hypothetical protein
MARLFQIIGTTAVFRSDKPFDTYVENLPPECPDEGAYTPSAAIHEASCL